MRLIDADALIAEIDGMIKNAQNMGSKFDLAISYGLIGANCVIKDAPTIEPSGDLISRADAIEAMGEEPPVWLDTAEEWAEHDAWVLHVSALKALPSAELPNLKQEFESAERISQTDSLILADALRYLAEDEERHEKDRERAKELREKVLAHGASVSAEPSRLTISKEEAEKLMIKPQEPNFIPQTKDCTDFLCWLLEEIMDEENWEMNAVADGEIIARKLKKLGLLEVKDGYYIRTQMYEALDAEPKRGEWVPLDGKLPKIIGHHVLVTIKWADDDLEVCEMCPTVADRYNIIAFQDLPDPYQGEPIKSELQCDGAKMGVSE